MSFPVPLLLRHIRALRLWTQLLPTSRAKRVYFLHSLNQTTPTKQVTARRPDWTVVGPGRTERQLAACDLARSELRWVIWIWDEDEIRVVFVRSSEWKPAMRAAHIFCGNCGGFDFFHEAYQAGSIEARTSEWGDWRPASWVRRPGRDTRKHLREHVRYLIDIRREVTITR
jgi:hypothetical protein